ncbi:MAG: hypothetical protein JWO36_5352 [Myxococcales bacterium]|nr:hypothetical protein [Myxococcales bacterium]
MFQLASLLREASTMRIAGCLFVSLFAACTTGDESPPVDIRGIQCSSTYTVTGSFVQSDARPLQANGMPITGCWPIGMWTFKVALVMGTCTPTPTPLAQYQFQGIKTTDPGTGDYLESFQYVPQTSGDPTANSIAKANTGGVGSCQGELSLFSADGKQVWSLKPELVDETPSSAINGTGEFNVFDADQWQPPG